MKKNGPRPFGHYDMHRTYAAGCSGSILTETSIGNFTLTSKTAESYAETVLPSEDNKLYVMYLTPETDDITLDDMQNFFFPEGDNQVAYISDDMNDYYSVSVAIESIKSSGKSRMVMVFDIPQSVDTDDLMFHFPK